MRRFAEELGVEFYTTDFDTRQFASQNDYSIEEAARRLRYGYFFNLCREHNFRYIATAHHRDDSIETFFLNLFRGTGIAGLHGIQPLTERPLMTLIRPMLCFSRQDIDDYVVQHSVSYVEDSTNSSLEHRRNQIRHRLMPLLRELYPSVDTTMVANMERLRQVEAIYDNAVSELGERLRQTATSPFGFDYDYFELDDLRELDPQRTLIFELLRPYGFSAAVVDDIIAALPRAQSGTRFFSPTYMAAIDRDRLVLVDYSFLTSFKVDTTPLSPDQLPNLGSEEKTVEYIDADRVHLPLTVRRWRPGDRFYPLGMKQQRRLSDFLKDCKVNIFEKYCVQLLVDADDRIVWVIGLRADNRFRVTPATRRCLRLSATSSHNIHPIV